MADYCMDNPTFDITERDMDVSVSSSANGLQYSMYDDETTLPSYRLVINSYLNLRP